VDLGEPNRAQRPPSCGCYTGLSTRPCKCHLGRSNRSKHGGRWPRLQSISEPRSAAGAVGAADRTRSGAERRSRSTAVAFPPAAQNGTSGVLADGKHARRWATLPPPRTGSVNVRGQAAGVDLQSSLRLGGGVDCH
jgi:hypothetical protein